jgi:hypothetical protein
MKLAKQQSNSTASKDDVMTSGLSSKSNEELFKMGGVEVYDDLHFVYSGDDHGPGYANFRPLGNPGNEEILAELSFRLIMKAIEGARLDISRPIGVVGPETLGAKMVRSGVYAYNSRKAPGLPRLRFSFFKHDPHNKEKFHWGDGGGASLMEMGTPVIWIDDLMNKGSTWERTKNLILDFWPGSVKAIATFGDRSEHTNETLGVPYFGSLSKISLERFPADECPLCKDQIPIVRNPGHGHLFEQSHPDHPGGFTSLD